MVAGSTDDNVSLTQRFYFSVKVKKPKWVIVINMMTSMVKIFLRAAVFLRTARNVWITAMFERIQSDATLPRSSGPAVTANRADLVAAPAPQSVELREKAVAPVSLGQRSTFEVDVVAVSQRALYKVRDGLDSLQRTEADMQELDRLYERLLPGYKALKDKMESPVAIRAAAQAAEEVDVFFRRKAASDVALKADAPVVEIQASSERERTLARIEAALMKVNVLRNKLALDHNSAHEDLLNINASVSGLNMARMQLSDDKVMASLASSACEAIMTNLRSVVVAHGNVSPDLVRLILN